MKWTFDSDSGVRIIPAECKDCNENCCKSCIESNALNVFKSLTKEELDALETRMREIVAADLPLHRFRVPLEEAIDYFRKKGHMDKVQLLVYRKKNYLTLYQLGDNCDYHHGYMVPSTGYLKWFKLTPTGEGFTLRFPRRHRPTELLPLPDYPASSERLFDTRLKRYLLPPGGFSVHPAPPFLQSG